MVSKNLSIVTIRSAELQVQIHPHGAELQSIIDTNHQVEYLWQGDPRYWGKRSPILFPIVGTLKNQVFTYQGNTYSLGRHGFAREMDFALESQSGARALFLLTDTEASRAIYPFAFQLAIEYRLEGKKLFVQYRVHNPDATEPCYFSIGAHPAFRLPLHAGEHYEDYHLEFEKPETIGRWPINAMGLLEAEPVAFMKGENKLALHRQLFAKDAIVLKGLQSRHMRLVHKERGAVFQFHYPGFPYMGLWSVPGADFLCIEPWCGIADSINASGRLEKKEGVVALKPGESFEREWWVEIL